MKAVSKSEKRTGMMQIQLNGISKKYQGFQLHDVSISVSENDYFILLGESGAGKTLILETIAGLVLPDSGEVLFRDTDITRQKIQLRKVGIVFQDHAIFPHLNVFDNIAYPLKSRKYKRSVIREKVTGMASQMGISGLLDRRPSTLSGGELQRVALARSLVQQPDILLLDEPLASLDTRLKAGIRALLREIHKRGQTIIHVTHDYEEALALGTRIAVVDNGTIVQEGSPDEVFHHPQSSFVAHFIGIRNYFRVKTTADADGTKATTGEGLIIHLQEECDASEGFVLIRGEDILLANEPVSSSAVNVFHGTINEIQPTPRGIEVCVDAGTLFYALITQTSLNRLGLVMGQEVWIHFKATAVRFIKI
jgi:molybdopterin-binding protein